MLHNGLTTKWDVKYSVDQSEVTHFCSKPQRQATWHESAQTLGYNSTVFTLVLEDSSHPYTNGDLLLTSFCECGASNQTTARVILEFYYIVPSEDTIDC